MQNDLMKKTTVLCSLFVAAAMGVMLWFCTNKIVVVADVAQDEVVQAAESSGAKGAAGSAAQDGEQPSAEDGNRIDIERDSENTNLFLCAHTAVGAGGERDDRKPLYGQAAVGEHRA